MSIPGQTYINTFLAVSEFGLNIVGSYLPSKIGDYDLSKVRNTSITTRNFLGIILVSAGALTASGATIAHYAAKDTTGFYKNLALEGITYVGHGFGNLFRSGAEYLNLNALLAMYDVIGQKPLTYTNVMPSLDPSRVFVFMKEKAACIPDLIPSVAAKAAAFL